MTTLSPTSYYNSPAHRVSDVSLKPLSSKALADYLRDRHHHRGGRPRAHHCPGCCDHCRCDADAAPSPDASETRRLRCAAARGRVDTTLLLALGRHSAPGGAGGGGFAAATASHPSAAWPTVFGEVMWRAETVDAPFADLHSRHGGDAARAAVDIVRRCRDGAAAAAPAGAAKLPPPTYPRRLLLLHAVGSWGYPGGEQALLGGLRAAAAAGEDPAAERDAEGRVALHYAAASGFPPEALVLLGGCGGAAAAVCDEEGRTPLHAACEAGRVEAALCLVAMGADPAAQAAHGLTALHRVCEGGVEAEEAGGEGGRRRELLEALSTPRAVAARSARGWTPLHTAACALSPLAVRVLLAKGADASTLSDPPRACTPLLLTTLHHGSANTTRSGRRSAFRAVVSALGGDDI